MAILNNYWAAQTAIFLIVFIVAVFISARRKTDPGVMPKETSNELRGLAILGVLFAHLTYGKFFGTEFLFPLGIWGGIAVNLFLFLSGYGLAASVISHPKTPWQFYRKRLTKIIVPLWLSLMLWLILDAVILQRFYPLAEVIQSFLGFFPVAEMWQSINSPLWFLTPLLVFYLVWPILFRPKHPIFSSLAVLGLSFAVLWSDWPVSEQVLSFYQTHFLVLPLGAIFAVAMVSPQAVCKNCVRQQKCLAFWLVGRFKSVASKIGQEKFLVRILAGLKSWPTLLRLLFIILLAGAAGYTAYYSGVGKGIWPEQLIALLTMACLVLLFIIKKSKFALLEVFGVYSFEIYLLHWPLISRYDVVYRYLPPYLATIIYLPILLAAAWLLNQLIKKIVRN
jgi:peptidoglycan/LPS O-acetylase OafA/YrhL